MEPSDGANWEQVLIGTVLSDIATMEEAEELQPQDFTGANRTIWREVLGLHKNSALEKRALIEVLRSNSELERIGGEEFLDQCIEKRGGLVGEYVRQIIEHSTRRQLREAAALIATDCLSNPKTPAQDLLDEAERRLMALRRERETPGTTMAELADAFTIQMSSAIAGTFKPAFEIHCQALKDILDFIDTSDFVLVGARPGCGKSSLLRYEAFWKARRGVPGLIFNLENNEMEYLKGFVSLDTHIDSVKFKNLSKLTRDDLEKIQQSLQWIRQSSVEIVTLGSPSVAEIERIARAKMKTLKPKFIMVDYIQLIYNGIDNKVQDVTLSSQILKAMGMKNRLNIPIIAAAQLNRASEQRKGGPELYDLRESGSLEQDSTIVIFIRDDWGEKPNLAMYPENVNPFTGRLLPTVRAAPVRFYINKNRNGPTGISDVVKWCKHTGNFQTITKEKL